MENRGSADDVDKDSTGDGIEKFDFAEECSSDDFPGMTTESAASGSSPSTSVPPSAQVHAEDGRDLAGDNGTKKLELAPPSVPMHSTGLGMVNSLAGPPAVFASSHDIGPGAFPERLYRYTFRPPIRSYDPTSQLTSEESMQEEGVPNSTGANTGAHDSSQIAAGSGLYNMEAQRVPDGNEEGTVIDAETQYVRTKRYQCRWISLGLALFASCLVGAMVAIVFLVVRSSAAASSSSLMSSPTIIPTPTRAPTRSKPPTPDPTAATTSPVAAPTTPPFAAPTNGTSPPISTQAPTVRASATPTTISATPVVVACNFLSIGNVTKCRSTSTFGETTTGSAIPSEIGLLTQLTYLSFYGNLLTSTIPSEIGRLTQLTLLDLSINSLTSAIPSEIGLLTKLTALDFSSSQLTSTIPSEVGRLTQLRLLDFYFNSLTSAIPSEIGLLTKLTELDFSSNQLTSTIPSEIGLLTQLTSLEFYGNSLTSAIPSEIGLLTKLTALLFFSNKLTSTIPSEIRLLTQLTALDFFNNSLTGTVPSSLCSLSSLYSSILVDCGEVACASGCCYDHNLISCG